MLAELVRGGQLPPVDERLPLEPNVCPVLEMTGKHGGRIRRGFTGVSDRAGVVKPLEQLLTWFNVDLTLRPNVVGSWETNEDGTVWTWHLLPGTRWSDGEAFTAEAFMWFWEYELQNEELTTSPPRQYSSGSPSVLADFQAPDDYTVIITFTEPKPLLAYDMARYWQGFAPAHYMKQFHADFAEKDSLDKLVAAAGFQTCDQLYHERAQWWTNTELPMVSPWIAKNELSNELFILERNPYFWHVDQEGQQLPYLDQVIHRMFDTVDTFNMWILNGEIDFQGRHVDIGNYTLFKEGEETGDYILTLSPSTVHTCLSVNQGCREERLREFFQSRNVRLAMSYAVNRDEINDLVFDGLATPRQYSPIEGSPNFYPKLSNAHLDYDPDKANALLDGEGYTERDAEGFRVFKDGSGDTIFFAIEGYIKQGSPSEDHILMVVSYLADVGIKCAWNYDERSLYEERMNANMLDAGWGQFNNRAVLPIVTPWFFIGTLRESPWACGWDLWRVDPSDPNAVAPPEDHWYHELQRIYYEEVVVSVDEAERNKLFEGILDIWAEELPQIGYLGQYPAPVIVKNGLRNWLGGYPNDGLTKQAHLIPDHTLFWEEPEKHTG